MVPGTTDIDPLPKAGGAPQGRFQVLALDGGGVRGLFSAAVLAKFEEDCGTTVVEHFDLITGTSTGGLLALGLGAGMTPAELVDLYCELGKDVFPPRFGGSFRQCFRSKHSPAPLRRALETALGDLRMQDSCVPLVVPAFDLTSNTVHVFKTPHHSRLRRDGRRRMVDVALATTAAPTYLPAHRVDGLRLIDGGTWVNNPAALGVAEALSLFGRRLEDVHVLSIGTTAPLKSRGRGLDKGGWVQWAWAVSSFMTDVQSRAANGMAFHLIGDRFTRVDKIVPDGAFRLDRLDRDGLYGHAEAVSREHCPAVSQRFFHHQAQRSPIHNITRS